MCGVWDGNEVVMRWAWSLWGVMKGDGDSGVGMVEMGAVITLVLQGGALRVCSRKSWLLFT